MEGWPRCLGLEGTIDQGAAAEAAEAIELERRAGVRPTTLRVVSVYPVDDEEHLYELEVESDRPLEDGTAWMGAELRRDLELAAEVGGVWRAELLEVDAATHRLFVDGDPVEPPCTGLVKLWPYDFLESPRAIYGGRRFEGLRAELASLLAAAAGDATGQRVHSGGNPAWQWSWAAVWGPPGTGKTWTLGREVAALLRDPTERVLVVSTTHRATDAAALELGEALEGSLRGVRRVGRVFRTKPFREAGLEALLPSSLEVLEALERARETARDPVSRATAQRRVRTLSSRLASLRDLALDEDCRALVATLHAALRLTTSDGVTRMLEDGRAPFTTVVLDEAGLIGRAQVAVASLLAARRVVLVGDPRQLSPIARAARSLPRQVLRWLARSGLDHLHHDAPLPHVQRLVRQRRMHPSIRAAIADLQYGGILEDAPDVVSREWPGSGTLRHLPRVLWIPVDADPNIPAAEAASQRGPGGRSRVRPATQRILSALLAAQPELRSQRGLFISPFKAQARLASRWLREVGLDRWRASTVHAQQGAEAQVVVFDTVHASSTAWPAEEWCRLVNVGLSRARELVVLVASRQEVDQPWMRPLRQHLVPRILRPQKGGFAWTAPASDGPSPQAALFARRLATTREPDPPVSDDVGTSVHLGAQIERRRRLRPVLSSEQRVLAHRELSDAGPRLVRGVAGSGKTLVLAHWVARTLRGQGFERLGVFYTNKALKPLLTRMLDRAWQGQDHLGRPPAFPWERVELLHLGQWLKDLLRERQLDWDWDQHPFDYEGQARHFLERGPLEGRLDAVFVDEAQDMGHEPLRLVIQSVRPYLGRRPVMVFYDNAQNLYGRSVPRWSEFGLDMRGRSEIMRESFRSTRPNTELALNLMDRLRSLQENTDFRELIRGGLLVQGQWEGRAWWEALFCSEDGQLPAIEVHSTLQQEVAACARRVRRWLEEERVRPGDIRVIANSRTVREALVPALKAELPCRVVHARAQGFEDAADAVVVTTPHSFKGYDAEVVVVAGVDRFAARGEPLVEALYVALTRARTLLHVSGSREGHGGLVEALEGLAELYSTGAEVP